MTKSTERLNYRSSKWLLAIRVAMYLRAGQNLAVFTVFNHWTSMTKSS